MLFRLFPTDFYKANTQGVMPEIEEDDNDAEIIMTKKKKKKKEN